MSRNQQDEMIRASDAPQMMKDLQPMKRQLEQLGRQLLLTSIEQCPSYDTLYRLWAQLQPHERQDEEIVYKFLSCPRVSPSDLFNSVNPGPIRRWDIHQLPERFISDPSAVIAYVSNDNIFLFDFQVHQSLRDNKEVMMAVCAKCPRTFKQASSRLRDDEDLVRTALLNESIIDRNIRYVSERLRKDKTMLLYTVSMGCFTQSFMLTWLSSLHLRKLGTKKQSDIARLLLHCLSLKCPHDCDRTFRFLSKFSRKIRDDKDLMMQFVKLSWTAIGYCSARLRADMDVFGVAVSQDINAYQYATGATLEEYQRKRNLDFVLKEIDEGLFFRNVPDSFKGDRDILVAAIEAGQALGPNDFPVGLKNDKKFMLDVIKAYSGDSKLCKSFYSDLSEELQTDEDIAMALLQIGFPKRVAILKKVPSLLASREAMMLVVQFLEDRYNEDDDWEYFPDFIRRCDYRDDDEFMLEACKTHHDALQYASERLRSNRDFINGILDETQDYSAWFIIDTTRAFQVENPDFMVSIIEHASDDDDLSLGDLNEANSRNKEIVMAFLQKGWSVLKDIVRMDANSPLLLDKEVVFLSVKNRPADLKHAARSLQEDRGFILSLVKETDNVLQHAPSCMKLDKEIVLAALARSSGTIPACFDAFNLGQDFEFLCNFTSGVRSAIATHQSFYELLRGMNHSSCRLSLLNRQGEETDIALKRLIAKYAGVRFPMAPHIQTLKAALNNLEKLGF